MVCFKSLIREVIIEFFFFAAVVLFQNITGLFRIQPHAFAASVDRLRVLTIDSSPLSDLSVAGISDLENLVDFEVTASVNQLTVLRHNFSRFIYRSNINFFVHFLKGFPKFTQLAISSPVWQPIHQSCKLFSSKLSLKLF